MLERAASRWFREFLAIIIVGTVVGLSVWYVHAGLVAMHRDGGAISTRAVTNLSE